MWLGVYPLWLLETLPPRIDGTTTDYLQLVDPVTAGGLGEGQSYSPAVMDAAIARALQNQGALGMYCNSLMLNKALYGRLSTNLPAALEAVIDGSVKSGADLQPVKAWNKMVAQRMVAYGRQDGQYAIPAALLNRLPEWLRASACQAERHWLDSLVAAMETHKAQYVAEVEALAVEACPPLVVFEQGRDWLHVGRDLRQVYANVLRQAAAAAAFDETVGCDDDEQAAARAAIFDKASAASKTFLQQWPADKRHLVLLGAMAYLKIYTPDYRQLSWLEVWQAFATIYPGSWALELYPPANELVNDAHVYHLWLLPEGDVPPHPLNLALKYH